MARTVDDVIALYRVLTRPDPRDIWSLPPEADDRLDQPLDPRGLRIGLLTDLGAGPEPMDEVLAVVRAAAAALASAGAVVKEGSAPFDHDPYPALDRLFQVRARTEWESLPEPARDLVLPVVAVWAAGATQITATQFARDTEAVMAAQARLADAIDDVDFVLSPVFPVVGFPADAPGADPAQPLAHTGFTAWFNQTGQPAASVCFGLVDGMPVGVQVAGRRFADQDVLRLTKWIETHRPVSLRWPIEPEVR
jgi:amidase/aspartyl-tRNA(Asn)/glutamyl-tRNA(Gln) amidotransferase subunit A